MTDFLNIEVIIVDNNTISVDGEKYYSSSCGWYRPYVCFDMIKIIFNNEDRIAWDPQYKQVWVPIGLIKNRNHASYFRYFESEREAFLLEKDKSFVDKLEAMYCGVTHRGPDSTIDARKVTPSNKLPKVVKISGYYYFFDKKLYHEYQ